MSVAGSSLIATGLALAPVTVGASLLFSFAGGVVTGVGGIIVAGSELGYIVNSRIKRKDAKHVKEEDEIFLFKESKT